VVTKTGLRPCLKAKPSERNQGGATFGETAGNGEKVETAALKKKPAVDDGGPHGRAWGSPPD